MFVLYHKIHIKLINFNNFLSILVEKCNNFGSIKNKIKPKNKNIFGLFATFLGQNNYFWDE